MFYKRCRECHESFNPKREGENGFCAACAKTEKEKRLVKGAFSVAAQVCRIEAKKEGVYWARRYAKQREKAYVERSGPIKRLPVPTAEERLKKYSGENEFLLSLKDWIKKKPLTPKQAAALKRIWG